MEQGNGAGSGGGARAWLERKRQREELWRGHLAQWRVSGLTQAAYCRREKLMPADFSWWKYELARRDGTLSSRAAIRRGQRERVRRPRNRAARGDPARPRFAAVRLALPNGFDFEVVLRSGETVRCSNRFDTESLKRLIALLREESRAC